MTSQRRLREAETATSANTGTRAVLSSSETGPDTGWAVAGTIYAVAGSFRGGLGSASEVRVWASGHGFSA